MFNHKTFSQSLQTTIEPLDIKSIMVVYSITAPVNVDSIFDGQLNDFIRDSLRRPFSPLPIKKYSVAEVLELLQLTQDTCAKPLLHSGYVQILLCDLADEAEIQSRLSEREIHTHIKAVLDGKLTMDAYRGDVVLSPEALKINANLASKHTL